MNPRLLVPVLATCLGCAVALFWAGEPPQTAMRTFEFQYTTRIPAQSPASSTLRVWIPVPETDSNQKITRLNVESPVPYVLHHDPAYRNQYAYLEIPAGALQNGAEVRMRFRAERREVRVPLDSPAGGPVGAKRPADVALYLKPDKLVPTDGLIAQLAEQETRGKKAPLEKARAIYDYVVSTMKYDKSGEGWGRGDAIYACNVRKGNCTDFHSLFIGMMRAAGIPARFEIGFPIPPDKTKGEISGYHCWAQFYVDGIGWIPVDASEAWKNPAKRDYFFGAHDQHRVLFTRGRDIRFNPAQEGEPLNYFIYSYAELGGKPVKGLETMFQFRDLARPAR